MNLFDVLLLISEIGSSVQTSENIKNFQKQMRELRIHHDQSFLKDLPTFKHDYINLSSGKAFVGDIVKRPLNGILLSSIEDHYGIVLGTCHNDEEWILEMTKGLNIHVTSKSKFLSGSSPESLQIELRGYGITRDTIIDRASLLRFEDYSLLDLNCKDVAYYCVCNIKPPKRSKDWKEMQLAMNDMATGILHLQLGHPDNARYFEFIKRRISRLEEDRKKILADLAEHNEPAQA